MIVGLPEKAIQKVDHELLELHKEVLRAYLTQGNLKHRHQKKFLGYTITTLLRRI